MMKRKLEEDEDVVVDSAKGKRKPPPFDISPQLKAENSVKSDSEGSSVDPGDKPSTSSSMLSLSSTESELTSSEGSDDKQVSEVEDEEDEIKSTDESETSNQGDDQSEEPINVMLQRAPSIQSVAASNLESRLSSFLPALAAANESLRDSKKDLMIEREDGDDGQYIEMNLGLGVLEEKPNDVVVHETSSSSSSDEEDKSGVASAEKKPPDMINSLLRKRTTSKKPQIEEIDGG